MRQQTQVSSVLPFSFTYRGNHPAGFWLMQMLQKHQFHLSPLLFWEPAPLFYALDQSFLKALGEPVLSFPLEWCEQTLTGQVTYSEQYQDWLIVETSPLAIDCLDLPAFSQHLSKIFNHYRAPDIPQPDQTQPLSLVWEWLDVAPEQNAPDIDFWCVSGELAGAFASYGVLQKYASDTVSAFFCYRPATHTTFFTAEIKALNPQQAREIMLESYSFMTSLTKDEVNSRLLFLEEFRSAAIVWPKISWDGSQIVIASQKPDLRPVSLMQEGYCWGLMIQLLRFLNTRYTSPEAVFQRLQYFDQKMRYVLSPFL